MWRVSRRRRLALRRRGQGTSRTVARRTLGRRPRQPNWLRCAGAGIEPETVEQVGDAGRKATLRDPDGNTIALIEVAS